MFVNSLASTDPMAKAEVRLIARNNEILATRKTDDAGHVLFEAGLAKGDGGLSPALLTAAAALPPGGPQINPDDPYFIAPANMNEELLQANSEAVKRCSPQIAPELFGVVDRVED